MKQIFSLVVLLVFVPSTLAHGVHIDEMTNKEVQKAKHEFNNYSKVPDFLGSLVGDQNVAVNIENESSVKTIGAEIEGAKITDTSMESPENTTLEVQVNKSQINHLLNSDNPIQKTNKYLREGKIEYSAKGTINKLRFYIAEKMVSTISKFT